MVTGFSLDLIDMGGGDLPRSPYWGGTSAGDKALMGRGTHEGGQRPYGGT